MRALLALMVALCAAPLAQAACVGQNQIAMMPAAEREALVAAADAVPFARGNLWRATKQGREIVLVGTLHIDDSRHQPLMERVAPLVDAASVVLLEAGPEEEAELQTAMAGNPGLLFDMDGPTLPESLPPAVWDQLKQALRDREIPPFLGARMQPGFVSMLLSIPPCATESLGAGAEGLDQRIAARAAERGIPVRGLESFETLFRILAALTPEEQQRMLTASLSMEGGAEDAFVTMADAYFAGQSRLIWELNRRQMIAGSGLPAEQVEADIALMEETLVLARNRAWVPVIEAAAGDGPVLVAFGALHLPGEEGVLNLLARAGWRVKPLAAQAD